MSITKGIALVTGAAQGIGRSIALRLAKDGFDVALNDIRSKHDQLCGVADDIEKIDRRTLLVPADVSIEQEVKDMIQDVSKELGGLDVMVANAGICKFGPLVNTSLDNWEQIMAVNARGPFLCYKYAAQQMIQQGRGGRIIGASSSAGKVGSAFLPAYSASKFAVRGLTHTAAMELGRYNITVNCYAPGAIETPMSEYRRAIQFWRKVKVSTAFGHHTLAAVDPELADIMKTLTNSNMSCIKDKPIGQPEDVANLVSFLASKDAHWITGQCISVNGGTVLS